VFVLIIFSVVDRKEVLGLGFFLMDWNDLHKSVFLQIFLLALGKILHCINLRSKKIK